jgi:acetyltransferase-like isoleucine patch superfamily enzyme
MDPSSEKRHRDLPVEEPGQQGWSGRYERWLRRFPELTHGLTLIPVYGVASLVGGAALVPGVLFFEWMTSWSGSAGVWIRAFLTGIGVAGGFFLSGFALMAIVPAVTALIRARVRPGRGASHSNRFIPWYLFNSLAYLVRYTILEFVTPTPVSLWYFRAMGMKVGKNVVINTTHITDAPLITLEDGVTLGGSAVILGHYGMEGYLILAPVVIRKNAVIGLHAKILADVEIGEGARILPGSVVMPKTVVPAGEIWGGIPAVRIEAKKLS